MKAPLFLSLAALCASAWAASVDAPPPPPRTFEDVACNPKDGTGVLLRYEGDAAGTEFGDAEARADGLERLPEPAPETGGPGGKPGPRAAPPPPAPKTYRLSPGEGCAARLGRLRNRKNSRGEPAADFQIIPDAPDLTAERIEAAFDKAGTLKRLSGMTFQSPAALTGLFDNALSPNASVSGEAARLLGLAGAPPEGVETAGGPLLVADDGSLKVSAAGSSAADFRPKPPSPNPATTPPSLDPPPKFQDSPENDPHEYSDNPVVRGYQKYVDEPIVEPIASKIAQYRFPPDSHFTLSPGEAAAAPSLPAPSGGENGFVELPGSGPGYRFVGRGQYGRYYVVRDLMKTLADPDVNAGGQSPYGIVAISLPHGGPFPPHVTHQHGIDVDVALWGYHGRPLDARSADRNLMFAVAAVEIMKPTFILLDTQRQEELWSRAEFLLKDPQTDEKVKARIRAAAPILFTATPGPRRKKLFSYVPGHKDHFHVEERSGRLGQ